MNDRIEFYNAATEKLIATVGSSMVPTIGSMISIRKKTWCVAWVTYALDDAGDYLAKRMRANVDLISVEDQENDNDERLEK